MALVDLSLIVRKLHRATNIYDAATEILKASMQAVHDVVAESRYNTGRIQRSILHLRPDGSYRSIAVLEEGENDAHSPSDPSFLFSATAWKVLCAYRQAIAIDVQLGQMSILQTDTYLEVSAAKYKFDGKTTQNLMQRRNTTHVLVVPLFDMGAKSILGMLSIEVQCPRAVGRKYVWLECLQKLELLLMVGGPYLERLPDHLAEPQTTENLEYHSLLPVIGQKMSSIVRYLNVFAKQQETILLMGATGTGKSRLARWCHAVSRRANGPFVVIDLNAVPKELQLGELFGWTRGAFTGALKNHDGALVKAEGGTLFIDEIDKLDLSAQSSLLHLLEEGKYRVIGSDEPYRAANVRFIVGTNKDLLQAIEEGTFLEDLYYRINVLPMRLPSLTDRQDEIVDWANYMLKRCAQESDQVTSTHLSTAGGAVLKKYPWPGNLRQLANIVQRAFAYALVDIQQQEEIQDLMLDAYHIELALRIEQQFNDVVGSDCDFPDTVMSMFARAAEVFVTEAIRRNEQGQELLDLDHTMALRGLVLEYAIDMTDDIEQAFTVLGKRSLVQSRNHQRALRQSRELVSKLKILLSRDSESKELC